MNHFSKGTEINGKSHSSGSIKEVHFFVIHEEVLIKKPHFLEYPAMNQQSASQQ